MKGKYYSSERSIQILISLLKQHNIKKVVASPGATNLSLVASMQQDPFFEMYSSVDERSAAYIACGLAAESGEPVVLSCTGATASRNYIPGLTEAYYRKLPIVAVTSTQDINRIGHLIAQVIDRRVIQNDIALLSEHISVTYDANSEWSNTIRINRALLELHHRGGGPVHLNLTTTYSQDYSVEKLPQARLIQRVCQEEHFPSLPQGRIAVFIGSHKKFTNAETMALDQFCATHDSVVFCDHTSGYKGKYRVLFSLVTMQDKFVTDLASIDLLIHIGEVSGGQIWLMPKNVWRVSLDGELRDPYKRLTHIFEMSEQAFFEQYSDTASISHTTYLEGCLKEIQTIQKEFPETLPFSNIWIASQTAHRLPENSVLYIGILNSLRSWDLFEIPDSVYGYSNTGGFGIDGGVSSLVGASLVHPERLYYSVIGDLAFFYDMNVVGNRHIGNNVRLLLVNNGKGTEFRNYIHLGAAFGNDADKFISAGGHFGNKSRLLIKHYAEDLGFEYMAAENIEEYLQVVERFLTPTITAQPMLLEVFTDSEAESEALKIARNLKISTKGLIASTIRSFVSDDMKQTIKHTILNHK